MSIRKDVRELLMGSDYYGIEITPEQFGRDSMETVRQDLRETKDTGCVHLNCSKAGKEPDVTLCHCGECGVLLAMIQKDPAFPPSPQRSFFGLEGFRSHRVSGWENKEYRTLYIFLRYTPHEGERFQHTSKMEFERASLRRLERLVNIAAKAGHDESRRLEVRRIQADREKCHIFTSSIGRHHGPFPPLTEFEAPIVEIACPRCRSINYQDLAELA